MALRDFQNWGYELSIAVLCQTLSGKGTGEASPNQPSTSDVPDDVLPNVEVIYRHIRRKNICL